MYQIAYTFERLKPIYNSSTSNMTLWFTQKIIKTTENYELISINFMYDKIDFLYLTKVHIYS